MSDEKKPPQREGRLLSDNGVFAQDHGLAIEQVIRMGGAARLEAMGPEARALMLSLARRKRAKAQ